jgi:hypothetical protein
MIGKLIGAALGRKLAGENRQGRGEVIGFIAPAILKHATKPVLVVAGTAWAAKKLWDWRRDRRGAAA